MNTIENIWKTGHEQEGQFLPPKVEELYRKKSNLITEKISRTFKKDNALMPFMALLLLLGFGSQGFWGIGAYSAFLTLVFYGLNRAVMRRVTALSLTDSLYTYLLQYRATLKNIMRFYYRLLGWGLSFALLPPMYWFLDYKHPNFWLRLMEKDPWVGIIGLIVMLVLFAGIGTGSYYFSNKVLYGRSLAKLNELIGDLEHLKTN